MLAALIAGTNYATTITTTIIRYEDSSSASLGLAGAGDCSFLPRSPQHRDKEVKQPAEAGQRADSCVCGTSPT